MTPTMKSSTLWRIHPLPLPPPPHPLFSIKLMQLPKSSSSRVILLKYTLIPFLPTAYSWDPGRQAPASSGTTTLVVLLTTFNSLSHLKTAWLLRRMFWVLPSCASTCSQSLVSSSSTQMVCCLLLFSVCIHIKGCLHGTHLAFH